jgi:membrane glycosyltransferase
MKGTMLLLLTPKLLAAQRVIASPGRHRAAGGTVKLGLSTLAEANDGNC